MADPTDDSPELIRSLADPACYDHAAGPVRVIETHISHVLLTGDYAYKVKKPLDLGFLDFSSLDKRLAACREEVRLNRRLAPDTYLGVVPIAGTPAAPRVNGEGTPFEYAVKMRQFPPDATLDRLDAEGRTDAAMVEAIAATVARFHLEDCAHAPAESAWGTPEKVWQPVAQNFRQIAPRLETAADRERLDSLFAWSEAEHARLTPLMAARKRDGFVRECHGDLHLGNLAWVDGSLLVFDCLEFNPDLRWIDVQSELAFCWMDLLQRGHPDWAWLLLNLWLEATGDHAGLALLRYYAVYRALVRAKVAAIRSAQTTGAGHDIERASTLARKLVCDFGMSENLGPLSFGKKEDQVFLGREIFQHRDYSELTAQKIDEEVRKIITDGYGKTSQLIKDNMDSLHRLASALLEKETLDSKAIDQVLGIGREGNKNEAA